MGGWDGGERQAMVMCHGGPTMIPAITVVQRAGKAIDYLRSPQKKLTKRKRRSVLKSPPGRDFSSLARMSNFGFKTFCLFFPKMIVPPRDQAPF